MQSLAVTARLHASGRDEHCYRYTTDLYIIYTVTADRAGVDIDGCILALDLQGGGGGSPLKIMYQISNSVYQCDKCPIQNVLFFVISRTLFSGR